MKTPKGLSTLTYIYLAVGSTFFGIILLFAVLVITQNMGIDITTNLWWLAIPVILAVGLNIVLIEIIERIRK